MTRALSPRRLPAYLRSLSLLFAILTFLPGAVAAEGFAFLVLSDVPYTAAEEVQLRERAAPAIRASDAPFILFLGDFKSGESSCSDVLFSRRRDEIMALHPGRVFYSPGDNDWTDCDRADIPEPASELERLDFLRNIFFAAPPDLPAEWRFARQPLFPENMRWHYGGVVFLTLHMVSTDNGRKEILLDDEELALALVDARDRANLLWLEAAFTEAEKIGAGAIVIGAQADVTQHQSDMPCGPHRREGCDAFAAFRLKLRHLAAKFARPVLLVHGDTNPYCLDKAFGGAAAPKLWRLNSTGDFALVDAAEVWVNPNDAAAPFSVISLTEKKPPQEGCGAGHSPH